MLITVGIQLVSCQGVILSECVLISFIPFPLAVFLHSLSILHTLLVGLPFIERWQIYLVQSGSGIQLDSARNGLLKEYLGRKCVKTGVICCTHLSKIHNCPLYKETGYCSQRTIRSFKKSLSFLLLQQGRLSLSV